MRVGFHAGGRINRVTKETIARVERTNHIGYNGARMTVFGKKREREHR